MSENTEGPAMKSDNEQPQPSTPSPTTPESEMKKWTREDWDKIFPDVRSFLADQPPMPVPRTEDEIKLSRMA